MEHTPRFIFVKISKMKRIFLPLFLLAATAALAQHPDTILKEGIAIGEIGAAASRDIKSGKSSFGYSLAAETTPIENWLEIELGVSPTYAAHYHETDIDFLLKKPWTLSRRLEIMLGIGPEWARATESGTTSTSWSGEAALDLMYWPFPKHQFGFYAEPGYTYGLNSRHEQSLEMSAGLLVNIP